MIKRIARTAGFAGLLAAIVLTLLQSLWVTPLILQAETFETAEPVVEHSHEAPVAAHQHEHEGHGHDGGAWAPEDGWQRTLSTGLSNLVVAVGFALMLAGLFTLRAPNQTWQGLLWGLGGFAVFSLAPSAGLPPELPGSAAADLLLRQSWWIGTAVATATGLGLIAFARHWALRGIGLLLLAVPHLIGAPQPEVHQSLAPEALAQEFILASLLTNALFWSALGLAAAWFFARGEQQGA
ncbi:CbtA family protein [Pseudomonas aeruginosa]|jgi:cobalt transporter subunit CbtA|uniref:CbtA family protein n=1 Tax=Pseudomonas aeruginosa TaxID=287 RepID=UPI0005F21EB7|nr:CbtA family protein [Pseudomonas aeruginosa]OWG35903.1 cobalt transporter [Stutzerimonas stutzeri]TEB94168.1 cobalt transporter [Pseudomonas aeruginosa]HBP4950264.1 CbtA family protein [Pseudomonas aeruginosa]